MILCFTRARFRGEVVEVRNWNSRARVTRDQGWEFTSEVQEMFWGNLTEFRGAEGPIIPGSPKMCIGHQQSCMSTNPVHCRFIWPTGTRVSGPWPRYCEGKNGLRCVFRWLVMDYSGQSPWVSLGWLLDPNVGHG